MRASLRVAMVLSLLATAVVLAQAKLPTMDLALVASPREVTWVPAKAPLPAGVMQSPIAADPPPGGVIGYARYAPGASVPEHWHSTAEYSTVLAGAMRLKLDGKIHELSPGSYWVAPPKTAHQVTCLGPEECLQLVRRGGPVDYNWVK
jgi:quercetin dioxygenase-like cupin family protein